MKVEARNSLIHFGRQFLTRRVSKQRPPFQVSQLALYCHFPRIDQSRSKLQTALPKGRSSLSNTHCFCLLSMSHDNDDDNGYSRGWSPKVYARSSVRSRSRLIRTQCYVMAFIDFLSITTYHPSTCHGKRFAIIDLTTNMRTSHVMIHPNLYFLTFLSRSPHRIILSSRIYFPSITPF